MDLYFIYLFKYGAENLTQWFTYARQVLTTEPQPQPINGS